jgi:hypothetical protein
MTSLASLASLALATLVLTGCGTTPPAPHTVAARELAAKSSPVVTARLARHFERTWRWPTINGEEVVTSKVRDIVLTPTATPDVHAFSLVLDQTITTARWDKPAPTVSHRTRKVTGTYDAARDLVQESPSTDRATRTGG